MRYLIVYHTKYGNTEKIAEKIAREIGKEANLLFATEATSEEIATADLVIFGCPTHRFYASVYMRDFVDGLPEGFFNGRKFCVFDTRYHKPKSQFGSGADEISQRISRRGGIQLLHPQSFFVVDREGPLDEGELERAGNWVALIKETIVAATS